MNYRRLVPVVLLVALVAGIVYWWRSNASTGFSWEKFLEAGAQVDLRWLAAAGGLNAWVVVEVGWECGFDCGAAVFERAGAFKS